MTAKPQAERLIEAIQSLGVPRRDFSVRTRTRIIGGIRHYESAYLVLYTQWGRKVVSEAADTLRSRGLSVHCFGDSIHVTGN